MGESCCCPSEAGNTVCDLPAQKLQRPAREVNACPECGKSGKTVEGQTVKSLLAVSLREVKEVQYLFCRTEGCPVCTSHPMAKRYLLLSSCASESIKKSQRLNRSSCATVFVTQWASCVPLLTKVVLSSWITLIRG